MRLIELSCLVYNYNSLKFLKRKFIFPVCFNETIIGVTFQRIQNRLMIAAVWTVELLHNLITLILSGHFKLTALQVNSLPKQSSSPVWL